MRVFLDKRKNVSRRQLEAELQEAVREYLWLNEKFNEYEETRAVTTGNPHEDELVVAEGEVFTLAVAWGRTFKDPTL